MRKVVLVTGSSKGIGKSTIEEFAHHNYDVIINYNSNEQLALELEHEVKEKYKVNVIISKCDVSNEKEVNNMIEEIINHFGRLDVVVNNAGIAIDTTFEDKTIENFKKIIDINLIGTFLVSKYASKYMLQNKSGCIINVSSTNSINSYYPFSMDYDASKAGVNLLTKNLAVELAPYIRVNAVAPGWVNTPMNKELDEDFINQEKQKIALERFAEPTEIAKIIYFLSTEDASYINGSIIIADGGRK